MFSNLLKWGHNRHYNRGMVHFNRGEFGQAVAEFEAVLAEVRDPSNPDHSLARCYAAEARANLGLAFFHAGQYTKAEEQFTKALEENPTFPDLRYFRARIFQRSGRLGEAVADLQQALAEHPRYVEALLLLAVCQSQLEDRERSVEALNRALALGVELPTGLVASRASEWAASDWQGLLSVPAASAGAAAPSAAHLDRALERYHAGDLTGSIAELERAVAANPGYADVRGRLAGLLLEAGRIEEALVQLDHALGVNPRYLEARLLAARAHLELGGAREAIVHLEAALEAFPDYPDLHFWLGLARFRAGELLAAVPPLELAVKLNRQFARAQRLLGMIYHALGRHDDALRSVRRGLVRDREIPQGVLDQVSLALAVNDVTGMEEEIQRALAVQPDYPDLQLALARTRRAQGRVEDARESYRRALALRPGYDPAVLELAAVELALGHAATAEELLADLVARHPDWPDAQAQLGRVRLLRGDAVGAEAPLRAAVAANPLYATARADLGWTLLAQARTREADEEFARALELDPLHALPRQQLEWRELLAVSRQEPAARP